MKRLALTAVVACAAALVAASSGASGTITTLYYTVSPARLNFGSVAVGSTSDPKLATITNTSDSGIYISGGIAGTDGFQTADFHFVYPPSTCNGYLPGGESCILAIVATPTETGVIRAVLRVFRLSDPTADPTDEVYIPLQVHGR